MYKVYIKLDEQNNIIAANSSAFLANTNGWTEIEEGDGDKYHHAQNNYFDKPIMNEYGVYRYKYENNAVVEKSELQIAQETDLIIADRENEIEITYLKQRLAETDYVIIKIAEGVSTAIEYADIIEQRQAWRAEINELEEE